VAHSAHQVLDAHARRGRRKRVPGMAEIMKSQMLDAEGLDRLAPPDVPVVATQRAAPLAGKYKSVARGCREL